MVNKKVTEAVVIANRENGAKAKGQTSKRGKQRSRMNALVHSLYSRELKISTADEPEFNALRSSLARQFDPNSAMQWIAFDSVVAAAWRCKLVLRVEMKSLLNLTNTPESQETADPPSTMSGWYGASREAVRSGLRFLRDLKVETDTSGSLHLEDERWKGPIIRGFGLNIYNMLTHWKDLSPELLKLAVALDAKQRTFGFTPFPCENNVVADPQLKLEFISKLVDLLIQHLVDLQRVQTAGLADESPRASAESYSRLMLEANSELRKAVDFFCYLVSAGL